MERQTLFIRCHTFNTSSLFYSLCFFKVEKELKDACKESECRIFIEFDCFPNFYSTHISNSTAVDFSD